MTKGWLCPYCGKLWGYGYDTSPLCCGEVHCEEVTEEEGANDD